jgi:hypothetical protein
MGSDRSVAIKIQGLSGGSGDQSGGHMSWSRGQQLRTSAIGKPQQLSETQPPYPRTCQFLGAPNRLPSDKRHQRRRRRPGRRRRCLRYSRRAPQRRRARLCAQRRRPRPRGWRLERGDQALRRRKRRQRSAGPFRPPAAIARTRPADRVRRLVLHVLRGGCRVAGGSCLGRRGRRPLSHHHAVIPKIKVGLLQLAALGAAPPLGQRQV